MSATLLIKKSPNGSHHDIHTMKTWSPWNDTVVTRKLSGHRVRLGPTYYLLRRTKKKKTNHIIPSVFTCHHRLSNNQKLSLVLFLYKSHFNLFFKNRYQWMGSYSSSSLNNSPFGTERMVTPESRTKDTNSAPMPVKNDGVTIISNSLYSSSPSAKKIFGIFSISISYNRVRDHRLCVLISRFYIYYHYFCKWRMISSWWYWIWLG